MRTVIDINDFSFSIGRKQILRNVSLSVEAGETLSIIGPNGAGKSTLLKCIVRILHSPSQPLGRGQGGGDGTGRIRVHGRPLESYTQRDLAKLVSYVPQADGRVLPFTVHEFALMGRYPHLSPFSSISEADEQAVNDALALTGVQEFRDRHLGTLSGGERQKVFIAAALCQGAGIILLDEPTTFLDPKHQDDVHRTLARINRESGVTIVSVTHDVNTAAIFSRRVLALKAGAVAYCGPSDALMNNAVLQQIYGKQFIFAAHPLTGRPVIVPEEVGP